MSVTHDQFLADVAAIYIGNSSKGSFGSGRLIAPGFVLTAGHVVDYPTRDAPTHNGWKVSLLGNRTIGGAWLKPAYSAELAWRGSGELDLALLRITDAPQPTPELTPVFASYDLIGPITETDAEGFPDAWRHTEAVRDYTVRGVLRIASQLGPFAWSVPPTDKPDDRRGWKGMSGAALCRASADDKLYLFGVVQEVPANFSEGLLEVARVSQAFEDTEFRSLVHIALGTAPVLTAFQFVQIRPDLGIARIFQTRTRAFTEEYLVSETGPVPFGGRDEELRRLDEWLLDPRSSPRTLVTAPAGRGKSALLVRWMKNLQDGGVCAVDGWQLAFMPISIRTGTNRPEVFYEGLARRLSEISGRALPPEAFRDSDGFRYAVRDQVGQLGSTGRPKVLIVVDGIDEALEGFDADVLPKPLTANLRVLLSARWQVGDQNSKGWLERLGWDRGVKVEAFELNRLTAAQIADVLVKLGGPVNVLTQEPGLVERLAQLTEGEPLLVRYYAEDLWGASSKEARVTRADPELLKPGFDSYFKRWFELQEKLWKEEGTGIDRREVDAVLSILAFALGPLGETDLLALVECIQGFKGLPAVDRMLEPLRRWVFGNGKGEAGYVLSHPKIGEYLQRSRFAATAARLRQGFADWGKAHCLALNGGRLTAEQASPYCLQFLPEHLKQAKATPDDFMLMVENGWRCAWEKFEGGQRGFASAVGAAFAALTEDRADLRIGARWRCALALSSIKSLGQNVPVELALAAVDKGVLTMRQAAHFADLKGSSNAGVRLLTGLLVAARDNPALSEELLRTALATGNAIGDGAMRAEALVTVAPHLPVGERQQTLRDALAAVEAVGDYYHRSRALAAIAPHLPLELLGEALAAAEAIGDDLYRSEALAAVAPHLPLELLGGALAAGKAIGDDQHRSQALAAVAPHLPLALLGEALAAAKTIGNDYHRILALAALAPHLPAELRRKTLGEALAAANTIGDNYYRANALAALATLASHLPAAGRRKTLGEALAAAKDVDRQDVRAQALAALAPDLPAELLGEALAAAKAIGDENRRGEALAALAPRLPAKKRQKALREALAAVGCLHFALDRMHDPWPHSAA